MTDGLLPTYEEIVDARDTLTRIIEGIAAGAFGVLEPEDSSPLSGAGGDETSEPS